MNQYGTLTYRISERRHCHCVVVVCCEQICNKCPAKVEVPAGWNRQDEVVYEDTSGGQPDLCIKFYQLNLTVLFVIGAQ